MKFCSIAVALLSASVGAKSHNEDHSSPLDVVGLQLPPRALLWDRELHHTIPPFITPKGCKYEYEHDWDNGILRDSINCPNWCGEGNDFTLTVQSSISENYDADTIINCKLIGCSDCGEELGDCPCPKITSFEEVCDSMCFAESEVKPEIPTSRPSLRVQAIPSDMPSYVPSDMPSDMPSGQLSDQPSDASR